MSDKRPFFGLRSNVDKARFKQEVGDKSLELQSDLTVQFFADKLGIREKIIDVNVPESGPLTYQHHVFYRRTYNSQLFHLYECSRRISTKCCVEVVIPKTAQPGLRQALYTHSDHNHSGSVNNYDEFGLSIHLIELVEVVETLHKAGVDVDRAFKNGFKQSWIDKQNDEVKSAAEYFEECRELFNDFDAQFKKETDSGSTVYARFKVGAVVGSSFSDKLNSFATIGWRSGTAEELTTKYSKSF